MLEMDTEFHVVGEAADGSHAVEVVRETRPDVVIMDVRMPLLDGLEATKLITSDTTLSSTHVLVLTTFDVDEYIFQALRHGASGFLLKDVEAADLRTAVRTVANGDALLSPAVTRRVVEQFAKQHAQSVDTRALGVLTEREREVVSCVGRGMSNSEIAKHLTMSPLTAKTHVSRAMTKLHCRDRAQLVVVAYETGLVKVSGR